MEEESWKENHGGCIMEESSFEEAARQSGGGTQEAPGDAQEAPGGTRRTPGDTRRHPGGSQGAPRSAAVSVSVSVPMLLRLRSVFKGSRHLRAAGQHLRDPR